MNVTLTTEQAQRLSGAGFLDYLESIGGSHAERGTLDAHYRKSGGVSQSFLWSMDPMPAHAFIETPDAPHFVVGRRVHHAILTPHDPIPDVVVKPEFLGVDDKGKPWKWNGNRNDCKAWVAEHEAAGRVVMSRDDYEVEKGCIESLTKNPVVSELFAAGDSEVSLFRTMNVDSVRFVKKARIDWAPRNMRCLVDLKTVRVGCSGLRDFQRSIDWEGYGPQAASYIDDWNACHPDDQRDEFCWVVVEKGFPFTIQFYKVKGPKIEHHLRTINKRLSTFAECLRDGVFPGDNNEIQEVI